MKSCPRPVGEESHLFEVCSRTTRHPLLAASLSIDRSAAPLDIGTPFISANLVGHTVKIGRFTIALIYSLCTGLKQPTRSKPFIGLRHQCAPLEDASRAKVTASKKRGETKSASVHSTLHAKAAFASITAVATSLQTCWHRPQRATEV